MSLINRLAVNAVSLYSARALDVLLQLALLPFILLQVGREYYAAAVLIMSIQATADLARGGMQKATVKYVSEYTAKGDSKTANSILSSSSFLQGGIGICSLLACLILSSFTVTIFSLPVYMESEARWATVLMGIGIALSFALSSWQNSVAAHERYDLISLARVSGKLLKAALVVSLLLCKQPALITLVVAQMAGDIFERLLCYFFLKKINWRLKIIFNSIRIRYIKILLNYSFFDFFHTLSSFLYIQGPLYLATHLISLDAVAALGIIGYITSLLDLVMQQVGQMLVPLASRLHAIGEKIKLRTIFVQGTIITVFAGGIVMSGLLPWMDSLLSIWLGNSYVYLTNAAIMLLIASFVVSSHTCIHNILGGIGKIAFDALSSTACTAIGLIVGVVLLHFFDLGLIGLTTGMLCARLSRFIIITLYGTKIFQIPYTKFLWDGFLRSFILIIVVSFVGILSGFACESWFQLIAAGFVTALLYTFAGCLFIIDFSDSYKVLKFLYNSLVYFVKKRIPGKSTNQM